MNTSPAAAFLNSLVSELCKLPVETAWIEFKENNANPADIGEYISALSNSAALNGKANGYVVWGIKDGTHEIIGTKFKPFREKKGNENLENWLLRSLDPHLYFHFYEFEHEGQQIVVLEVPRAHAKPTQFQGLEYVRVGSCRQKLRGYPEIEKQLWHIFDTTPFDELVAIKHRNATDILSLLDYAGYFTLLDQEIPDGHDKIMEHLAGNLLIVRDAANTWNITHLGAILFARNLNDFKSLARKAIRIVVYDGKGRVTTKREEVFRQGYACGFEELIRLINALLPRSEVVGQTIRREVPLYPEAAIRELIPNALIHQDFSVTGSGPMVEIFTGRIEVTNPGSPLVSTQRFLDTRHVPAMKGWRRSCAA